MEDYVRLVVSDTHLGSAYSQEDKFKHKNAEGFIYMWGMSNKIWAESNLKNIKD